MPTTMHVHFLLFQITIYLYLYKYRHANNTQIIKHYDSLLIT